MQSCSDAIVGTFGLQMALSIFSINDNVFETYHLQSESISSEKEKKKGGFIFPLD